MKFLIAGYGSIGRRHFNNLKAIGQTDILFYRSGRGSFEDADLEGFAVERDIEAALGHQPDAVIVSNPTALHLDVAVPAANAGCHILLEKPISHSMADIDELQKAVAASGSSVLVGFQFRFHPGLLKIAEMLGKGELGIPLFGRAHWGEYLPEWHPWEDYRQGYSARSDLGGGVVLTLSHPFDYLLWLLGPVNTVSGSTRMSNKLEIEVDDHADAILHHSNGALINVHLDYLQKPPSHTLELILSDGMLRWDASNAILHVHRAKQKDWQALNLATAYERNDLFRAQMKHFVEVVDGRAQPACTLDDGIAALQIALAVHESAAKGQKVPISS